MLPGVDGVWKELPAGGKRDGAGGGLRRTSRREQARPEAEGEKVHVTWRDSASGETVTRRYRRLRGWRLAVRSLPRL